MADDGPLIVVFGSSHPSSIKKMLSKVDPSDKVFGMQWDGSFKHPQHMLKLMGKKIFTILCSIILLSWRMLLYILLTVVLFHYYCGFIVLINNHVDHAQIQRGEGGRRSGPSPLKIRKNIGFLSNTGPDLLEKHNASKPAFNIGPSSARQQNAI